MNQKFFSKIGILIILIILICGGYFSWQYLMTPKTIEPIEIEKISACFADNDCVLVAENCCPCSAGGGKKCINKNYVDEWNEELDFERRTEGACPQVYLCNSNPTGCKCSHGACVVIY